MFHVICDKAPLLRMYNTMGVDLEFRLTQPQGVVWLSRGGGIVKWRGGNKSRVYTPFPRESRSLRISCLVESRDWR